MDISTYMGTLLLHGMSEYAILDENALNLVVQQFKKFGSGEIVARGNFISYEAGGCGAAYLSWKGATDKLDHQVLSTAESMMSMQRRSPEGLMTAKFASHQIFIDVAFGVTPFLLYSGLKFNKPEYVDFSVNETLELFRILKDSSTGLVHQARGFQGEDKEKITEDNWSRGNGWSAFALSLLVRDLPDFHPQREEVVELAQQFFTDVVKFQDKQGLWHQEMSDPTSYVETSGSGLLLFGLGIMLEKKLLPQHYMENFKLGLQGYLDYIGPDGSVSNTCRGNLCPGDGTKEDYKKVPWVFNDAHAFGPVILAFSQAIKLGIEKVRPLNGLGSKIEKKLLPKPRTYVRPARGSDLAWENDRIAFRI
jgi:rhamnogalacturonyl hydrolase YesR